MGKFIAGVVLGVLGLAAGAYIYVHYGFFDMRADRPVGRIEAMYMNDALDKYAERHAPKLRNPAPADDANLMEGIRLYRTTCAGCHGGPEKPVSAVGAGFNPPAPQFLREAPDMPDEQNYWIIKHGVKMTGMPAFDKVLSDEEIWKLTAFVGKMGELDKLSPEAQQSWKGISVAPGQPATNPGVPAATPATPAPGVEHRQRH